ncbi:glutamate synthase subunit beta [Desulfuromonas acetoxidans]|uniref:glutamate synthase subunit beta n=1 Tax=Desulfuromonas acetoxidans TaxID=891 RepID=UPI00292D2D1B|nr:glutamate synthase subunit beta [Desulfuromonas acetoxidans]
MQSFIQTSRTEPVKSEVSERILDFGEIYTLYTAKKVALQAERCVQCGDPFCTVIGCPLNNAIPQWLQAIAEHDLEKAFRLSNETSPFPEVLGRVCPQANLCEGACTLDDGYGAITIGAIEASITDLAFKEGLEIPFPGVIRDKKVAVVGSGPAGMSCAHFLLRAGIEVEMFERASKPGGLLTYGIPGFKLEKGIVERRFKMLKRAGLVLRLNCAVGEDITLQELHDQYDAVFLGTGATEGKSARLDHENSDQVFYAMDYLTQVQQRLYGQEWDARFNVAERNVIVIGGGDTAMDCVRTAIREQAKNVTCLYRRDQANMPGSVKEYRNAVEEGVEFLFNETPHAIVVDDNGKIIGVDAVRTELGEPGEDGRQRVREIDGSEHCVAADIIILALGFDVAENDALETLGVKANQWHEIQTDAESGQTGNGKIFAGGDCCRGADLVVTAAADGRKAAMAIMEQLLGK